MRMNVLINKEVLSAIFNAVCAIICAIAAGCKLSVGELAFEFAPTSTNTYYNVVK